MKKIIKFVLPYLLVALEFVLLGVDYSIMFNNSVVSESRNTRCIVFLVITLLFVGVAVSYIFYYKRIVKELPKSYNIVLFVLSDFIILVLSALAIYLLLMANIDAWIICLSIVSYIPILITIISHHVIYYMSNKINKVKEE